MKTQITNSIKEVVAKNTSLSSFIQSLQTEKPTTKKSFLYDERAYHSSENHQSGEEILNNWVDVLKARLVPTSGAKAQFGSEFSRRIWELEESQIPKYGPQGGHPPMADVWEEIYGNSFDPDKAEILDAVDYYASNDAALAGSAIAAMDLDELLGSISLNIKNPIAFKKAVELTITEYRTNRVANLVPASHASVIKDLLADKKLMTNSGFPLFSTRRNPEVIKGTLAAISNGEFTWYPAIPLFRYYNGKLRGVWMYPFAVNVDEACFVRPFMKAIQNSRLIDGFYAPWKGFDAVKQRISEVYATDDYVAATDYSSTDRHFSLDYSVICGYAVASCFNPKWRAALFTSIVRMHTIPLVISNEEMLVGAHGVASGSEWTNLIETVGGHIMGNYEFVLRQMISGLYGIGDDMSHLLKASVDGDDFKSFISGIGAEIGQEIKPEKTTAEYDYVKSLQRLMQRGYYVDGSSRIVRGVYPTVRALKSIVWPERYHKKAYDENGNLDEYDKYDFCSRVYQILENTCDHPLFETFVAYVVEGNVELLKFVDQTDSFIDQAYTRSKRLSGLVDTYNIEYASRKMSEFASIKAAREHLRNLKHSRQPRSMAD